ncbi:MAG: hypothetical protein WDW38_008912 [Sanguina aurantia]
MAMPSIAVSAAEPATTFTYEKNSGKPITIPADVAALFNPLQLGDIGTMSHRVVYAPLTRCRAFGNIPQATAIEYYSQRSAPGTLVISEGTVVSAEGHGYFNTPGIWRKEEMEAWKPIVAAVHAQGALFVCQLWHVGRASHPEFQPNGALPMGPSAIAVPAPFQAYVSTGLADYPVPRAMTQADIDSVVESFRVSARNAIDAGFDGVEIHGTNGYIIEEFIKDSMNTRTDGYGGSIENRCRFALEIVAAVTKEVGAGKVGIRLGAHGLFLSPPDSTPYATYTYLLEKLNGLPAPLAYVHFMESRVVGSDDGGAVFSTLPFREVFKGNFLTAGGYSRVSGNEVVKAGHADAVAYGRHFLANPDLPKRFLLDAPLNKYDRNTFYSGGPEGYADYPFMEQQ